ncbi:unnamed protein product [Anisakis simplex]|uniref:Uncharacterized protein n=1 Tax=Anisakis simplex TaxID=6269 RepID=A0A3P6S4L5_ANISI|nr:unnamed protein product [Anisakis simplex]
MTIDPREREKVFAYLQYIKVLYRSQQLCAHLPCDMAQSYLLDELDKLPKNEEISAIFASSNLRMRLDGQQYRNALYEKLLNVIRDEFHNKPDGRVIVFVRTREFACRLSRAFDSDQVLSGLNVRTKMITGRGRAKDSRCLLLTHDKKLKEREDQNILRERLMNMALEVIDRQSSTWFKQEIAKNVAQINEERIKSKALIMEQERQNANKIYTLRCRFVLLLPEQNKMPTKF